MGGLFSAFNPCNEGAAFLQHLPGPVARGPRDALPVARLLPAPARPEEKRRQGCGAWRSGRGAWLGAAGWANGERRGRGRGASSGNRLRPDGAAARSGAEPEAAGGRGSRAGKRRRRVGEWVGFPSLLFSPSPSSPSPGLCCLPGLPPPSRIATGAPLSVLRTERVLPPFCLPGHPLCSPARSLHALPPSRTTPPIIPSWHLRSCFQLSPLLSR